MPGKLHSNYRANSRLNIESPSSGEGFLFLKKGFDFSKK